MKVLICDDEYATRFLTKSYLDMYSVESIEAFGGKEAISLVEEEKPDVLIIDYSMPDMTGLEVLKELKGCVPAIVLTSEGFTGETEKELKEFAGEYLIKPITPEILRAAIEKVTGKKINENINC